MKGYEETVLDVTFSPDSSKIATISLGYENSLRLWDLKGNQLAAMAGDRGYSAPLFSPDGSQLAQGFQLWDLEGNLLPEPSLFDRQHRWFWQSGFFGTVMSPNGKQIVIRDDDGTVRLIDSKTAQELAVIEGHLGPIREITFSPNGKEIAIVGVAPITTIWALNGQQIAQYEGYGTLSPDWKVIAVRQDDAVKLWPVYTLDRIDELLAAACQRLTPYLTHNPDISNEDRALCGIPPRGDE
jgi:WD40 repeat protein